MYSHNGKFLIYTPRFSRRFKTVRRAVARVTEMLRADVETSKRRNVLSVWVYYKNGGKEEIPLYCDWGKSWDEDEVYHAIRSVVHALSFHPEHSVLQSIRRRRNQNDG